MAQLLNPQRALLKRIIEKYDPLYDEREKMLCLPFESPGYHSKLTGGMVHPMRETAMYGIALLDSQEEGNRSIAEDILDRIISLQDKDPASFTYGIWSWFLEEPLTMMSPPDWNWADFIGAQLLAVMIDHRERIPPSLANRVAESLGHACRAIMRRDVGPDYTNIAILGAYVTLVSGEVLEDQEIREYGKRRLLRFVEYTRRQGTFTEYNSPDYTVVALTELSCIIQDSRDAEARSQALEMSEMGWEMVARHFHPPTSQWAGPHGRVYSTLLEPYLRTYLQLALEGQVHLISSEEMVPSLDVYRMVSNCPEKFIPFFRYLDVERQEKTVLLRDRSGAPVKWGITYLSQQFALSSVSPENFWNQRRAFLAYFGHSPSPGYLHLRVLHDHYDFSSAQIVSRQERGTILAGIGFATDGGDTHIHLDPIREGKVDLCDLRLRLEFGGSVAAVKLPEPDSLLEPFFLQLGEVSAWLCFIFEQRAQPLRFEVGKDGERAWIDFIWWAGRRQVVALSEIHNPLVGLALVLNPQETPPTPSAEREGDRIHLRWEVKPGPLALSLPAVPVMVREWVAVMGSSLL